MPDLLQNLCVDSHLVTDEGHGLAKIGDGDIYDCAP